MSIHYCCEIQRRSHVEKFGLITIDKCINCGEYPFYRILPTKKQAVPPLREKLSDMLLRYPGPLRGKPSLFPMRVEATKGLSVKPDEIIWDEWNRVKEIVYTPKQRPLTFRTEFMCTFLGNED